MWARRPHRGGRTPQFSPPEAVYAASDHNQWGGVMGGIRTAGYGSSPGVDLSEGMTMPRLRLWHAAALVMLVLTSGARCSSGSGITADSTCGEYLSTQTEERH